MVPACVAPGRSQRGCWSRRRTTRVCSLLSLGRASASLLVRPLRRSAMPLACGVRGCAGRRCAPRLLQALANAGVKRLPSPVSSGGLGAGGGDSAGVRVDAQHGSPLSWNGGQTLEPVSTLYNGQPDRVPAMFRDLTMNRSGRVLSASMARSSNSRRLDEKAVAFVRWAGPLPSATGVPGAPRSWRIPQLVHPASKRLQLGPNLVQLLGHRFQRPFQTRFGLGSGAMTTPTPRGCKRRRTAATRPSVAAISFGSGAWRARR